MVPGRYEEAEREILVGGTNREESEEAAAGLGEDQFTIQIIGTKLVIAGGCDDAVIAGLEYFLDSVLPAGSATLLLPVSITLQAELPEPDNPDTPGTGTDDPDTPEAPEADPLHPLSGLTVYDAGAVAGCINVF